MIPEDAIWILELIRNRDARTEAEKDAVNAAIEALKAQLSQEGTTKDATSDLISRRAAINAVNNAFDRETLLTLFVRSIAVRAIRDMPSVQPEPHEGTWVYGEDSTADCVDGYRCSQCGFFVPWDYNHKLIDYINDYAYCPNCGAKMKGERQK